MDILKDHLVKVVNRTWNYSGKLKTNRDHEQNAIIGLAAEAAEVLDVMKKEWFHTDDPDRRMQLRDELGDVMYYMVKVMNVYNFSMEEILAYNKSKLFKRHGLKDEDL